MADGEVMNAVASCGLQLYRFGETVSIPYWLDDWRPDSWYDSGPGLVDAVDAHFYVHFDAISSEGGVLGTDSSTVPRDNAYCP